MLYPTFFANDVTDITPLFLKKENIRGLILDIDNTLVGHGILNPNEKIIRWFENLKKHKIKIILLSNNFKKRVKIFAHTLDVPYVFFGLKPLTIGLKNSLKVICCKKENTLMVGDQIFTDILAANFFKIKSVLVKPVQQNGGIFLNIKRFLEKIILNDSVISNRIINLKNAQEKNNFLGGN